MPAQSYVVTRPHPDSGVGSNLASLAGAIRLAQRLGRAVIVDWRESAFLKDPALNYFAEFFETPAEMLGVEMFYAPCPQLPEPPDPADVEVLGATRVRETLAQGSHPARYVVLRDFHGLDRLDADGDKAEHFWWMKRFYEAAPARASIRDMVNRWAGEHLADAFIVGVNLAGGNGDFAKGQTYAGRVNTGIFADAGAFLKRIEQAKRTAVRGLPHPLRSRAKIFFATDSYAMRDLLLKVPGAVTRRTTFPPPGRRRAFCDYNEPGYTDRDAVTDAIVDMLLLAQCHALVRNGSVFNAYAQTVTGCFSGNVRNIESFSAGYWLKAAVNYARHGLGR